MTTDYVQRAAAAASAVLADSGVVVEEPVLLANGHNVLLHMRPAPVVVRVPAVTAQIRPQYWRWLERELAVASFASGVGASVVPPSDLLDSVVHERDGLHMTFWQHMEFDNSVAPRPEVIGDSLRELHGVLAEFPGDLPVLHPARPEIADVLDWAEERHALTPAQMSGVRSAYASALAEVNALALPTQALHGDSHAKNTLQTPNGIVWNDFEDCCAGPIEWDLACLVRTSTERAPALAAYGHDDTTLAPFLRLRELQMVAWVAARSTIDPTWTARAVEYADRYVG